MNRLIAGFKQHRPTVVLAFTIKANIYASLAGKKVKVPVICNVSGLGTTFLVKGLTGKIAVQLYKHGFKATHYVFFQNEDDKNLFTSIIPLPKEKLGLLPGSGIDLQKFQQVDMPVHQVVKFLMISRLIVEKGVREYAAAAAAFSDDSRVSFTLIGKLDESHARSISSEELNAWVKDQRLQYLPHSEHIRDIIAEHDVVVLPSYREGTPRTLLEGAALGRPLLTADVPGCREVVDDGLSGFLFEAKSAESLVAKVRLMLAMSPTERAQMGICSRDLVEQRFDEKIVIDKYAEAIHRIASS